MAYKVTAWIRGAVPILNIKLINNFKTKEEEKQTWKKSGIIPKKQKY